MDWIVYVVVVRRKARAIIPVGYARGRVFCARKKARTNARA